MLYVKYTVCILLSYCVYGLASRKECNRLGFNSDSLVCTKCDEMEQFFEGQTGEDEKQFEELVGDCRNCCSDQATSKKKSYTLAKLQVCDWKLKHYPNIDDFAKNHVDNIDNVEMDYIRGMMPQLKMINEGDEKADFDIVPIEKWTVDNIKEYLKEHLR